MSRNSTRSAGRISCSGRWPSCRTSESVTDRLFTAGQSLAGRHSVASKGENEVQAANFMNVGANSTSTFPPDAARIFETIGATLDLAEARAALEQCGALGPA